MSQMPPPPSPAPMGGTPAASGVGTNKKTYTILAYLFWWVTGLIFLFVGKDDPDVKYNSAAATVIHGAALAIYIILWILAVVTVGILSFLPLLWWIVWLVIWIVGVVLALQAHGGRVNFPVVGQMANQYVPMVEGWAK
jgi:uncharacterized membrane protein